MTDEYFNYGLAKDIPSKLESGMYSGGYQYTTNEYFFAFQAGSELGIAAHNIEVVLKFRNDLRFRKGPNVAATKSRGFLGGATQYSHPGRPRPVAYRKISDRNWILI